MSAFDASNQELTDSPLVAVVNDPPMFARPPHTPFGRPTVPPRGWLVVLACFVGFILCGQTVFAGLAGTLFVLLLSSLLIMTRVVNRRPEILLWLGSACAIALCLSVRASPWLISLDMIAICALLLLSVVCAQRGSLFRCSMQAVGEASSRLVGSWFVSPLLFGRGVSRLKARAAKHESSIEVERANSRLRGAVRSILLAVPVLVVVVPLLRAGDAAFSSVLGSVFDAVAWAFGLFTIDTESTVLGLIGMWVGLTLLAIAGWQRVVLPVSARSPSSGSPFVDPPSFDPQSFDPQSLWPAKPNRSGLLAVREVTGAVWIVNATLAVFAAGQVATAVGLAERLQNDVLSYREIAKDGFFPLLVASMVVLGALLIAHLLLGTRRWESRCVVATQVMIALNLVVVGVASRRLWVGADVWGLTMLRVCSQAAAVLLGVMLVTVAVWQHRPARHQPFVGVSVLGAVAILLVLNVLPIEQYIVNWNADRPAPDFSSVFDRSHSDPLDHPQGNDLGVARCTDYFDKWHGRNADAMPAFAPLIKRQLRAGQIDRTCQQTMLHCEARFNTAGLRWNFARSKANSYQSRWCSST